MRNSNISLILIVLMLAMDVYVFFAIRSLFNIHKYRQIFTYSYWVISVLSILFILLIPNLEFSEDQKALKNALFVFVFSLFFAKLLAALFFIIDDVRRALQWLIQKVFIKKAIAGDGLSADNGISRSVFLTWLGVGIGSTVFSTFIYGLSNKYNYKIHKHLLKFKNLPASFDGLKVVQLSDIHSGSFADTAAVHKGIKRVMDLKPDVILFTGDLVNNTSDEIKPYIDIFSELKAPLGVYSTLGNHDYGDYHKWKHPQEKEINLQALKNHHAAMGWQLLNDQNVQLSKNNEQISIIGVQNISGRGRFQSYGSLPKAMQGVATDFNILLSHDPSHWDKEVNVSYPQIQLTVSGHTHGMQYGLEIPGFKWSPIQYIYKQWAGLYQKKEQYLYVNRGFGFLGYPGRVGILPEITLFELRKT